MRDAVCVGMADYRIVHTPQRIRTLGLGSCMGVVLYDEITKICGMAHIMLPDSRQISRNSNRRKFADTCISDMYHDLLLELVDSRKLVAKIAGGAKMLSAGLKNEFLNIGAQNYVAVIKKLAEFHIPVIAEDVGETFSRTIEFNPETGLLLVKAVGIDKYFI